MPKRYALNIKQPWADLIVFGHKDVENRTWRPPGHVMGEATLLRCVERSDSPWFFGPLGFVLGDPQAYDNPWPLRGALGFFGVSEGA